MYDLVESPIDQDAVIASVENPKAGAIVHFVGTTRNHHEGRSVTLLEYESYPEMARKEIAGIGEQAKAEWEIEEISIVHRIGAVPIGEASVVIAVSAAHRDAAFAACRFAIDRLKEVVPIWKKEHFEGGQLWIGSQTGQEHSAEKE